MHVDLNITITNGRVHGTVTERTAQPEEPLLAHAAFEGWLQLIALLERAATTPATENQLSASPDLHPYRALPPP
jgi:hypothetical protein